MGALPSALQQTLALNRTPKRYIFYSGMGFEYDQRKSGINRKKHGIDFAEARELWNDPDLLEIPARTTDGPRFLVAAESGVNTGQP